MLKYMRLSLLILNTFKSNFQKQSYIMWGEYVTNKDNTITGILVLVEIWILVLQLSIFFLILYSLFIKAVVLLFIKYECGIFSTTCIFIF